MAKRPELVRGTRIAVGFDARRCIHSRHCVLERPDVFVPNAPGAWIHPDQATPEAVAEIAHLCPSGAITYERLDGGPQEQAPPVNLVRVRENGPLAVHAEIELQGKPAGYRLTLCRCGASKHKPYCDGSHAAAAFAATGEPPTVESAALAVRNGPLRIEPQDDGPLHVQGACELVSGTGRTVQRTTETWLCRCGASANKPFCDGSHRKVGFRSRPDAVPEDGTAG